MTTIVCPTCRGPSSLAASNVDRPFCSRRCRMLDLGAWLDESYAIPGTPESDAAPVRPVERETELEH